MQEFENEIADEVNRNTEHFNGTITTAGTPVVITTGTNRSIQLIQIVNPDKGTYANSPGVLLKVSFDGTNYTTLSRGAVLIWPGKGYGTNSNQVKLDGSANGTKYEVLVIS